MSCYKVKVLCTNSSRNTVRNAVDEYEECEDGTLYVVTDDPRTIYERWGTKVVSIERVGVGYHIAPQEPPHAE